MKFDKPMLLTWLAGFLPLSDLGRTSVTFLKFIFLHHFLLFEKHTRTYFLVHPFVERQPTHQVGTHVQQTTTNHRKHNKHLTLTQ
jgi:hypothetical protein